MMKTVKTVKKEGQQQQKRFQERTRKSEDSSNWGEVHPKKRNNEWKSGAKASKNVSCTSATLKTWWEYQRSRVKNCKFRSGNSWKGNSQDSDGIRAEDIKACDDEAQEMVRQIFNEIIKQNEFTLEAWKKVKTHVLHREGRGNVGNNRPICSLFAFYKLFSTILFGRLYPRLDQEPAEDQAGFRSSCQTTDHFATNRMIEQKWHEWCIKMWIATIDFTMAFDFFTHKSIWKALNSSGINHEYISLLKKIYKDQKASVLTDGRDQHVRGQERNQTGWPSV